MKIGILTFPGSPSHGAALQMFALYRVLCKQGHDVEIINYIPDSVNHKQKRERNLRSVAVDCVSRLFVKSSKPAFEEFEEQMRKYPISALSETNQLQKIAKRYDRIIVGSDQVWNPAVTGNDMNYYLAFSDNSKQKASYAPSFGMSDVLLSDRVQISTLLSDFAYLSAREVRGAEIIQDLIGKDVPVVLDPTMLVQREIWKRLENKVKIPEGKYVLYYAIKPSENLKSFAQQFADKLDIQLITIGGRLREYIDRKTHPVSGIGPKEFLWLIDNADYVVTNSFHGTAFSIIMQKKLLCRIFFGHEL